ncbi:hypothetical protein AYO49_05065 [Verrucomicrobiaceae bacterium SCGC AG-212-N21]|nr:hypothetical protein AYO49_05065 [Verrucomicrobiaceae bacterium SCGC AG-212-N21]
MKMLLMLAALTALLAEPVAAQFAPAAPVQADAVGLDPSQPMVTGIGVMLAPDAAGLDGMYTVGKLLPNSPSALSGLIHEGDRLLAVAEEGLPPQQLTGRPMAEVAGLIRGLEGSAVRLTIVPALRPLTEARDVTLLRARLQTPVDPAAPADDAEVEDEDAPLEPAPAPPLPYLRLGDQQQTSLDAEHHGKIVVVTFWASWSEAAVAAMNEFQKTAAKFANRSDKVAFVSIAIDGSADTAQLPAVFDRVAAFVNEKGWTRTVNGWSTLEEHRAWRLMALPTTHIVGVDGNVIPLPPEKKLEEVLTSMLGTEGA